MDKPQIRKPERRRDGLVTFKPSDENYDGLYALKRKGYKMVDVLNYGLSLALKEMAK